MYFEYLFNDEFNLLKKNLINNNRSVKRIKLYERLSRKKHNMVNTSNKHNYNLIVPLNLNGYPNNKRTMIEKFYNRNISVCSSSRLCVFHMEKPLSCTTAWYFRRVVNGRDKTRP